MSVSVSCDVLRTFRVEQMAGLFDLPVPTVAERTWEVEVPAIDDQWRIGAIVGPSGSGKSTIARQVYGRRLVSGHTWPRDKAIVDAFPEDMSMRDITGILNSVGFSSPPDWVKPYRVLSTGQQFRSDLARALLTPASVIAFDEFTSVVDRQVAQFGSAAVAKTIRQGRTAKYAQRFVAVTCHYDVLPWLAPDWVLDLGAGGRLARSWLQRDARRFARLVPARPAIRIDVCRAPRSAWDTFMQHHYLTAKLHHAARCYVGWWEGTPVAFGSTLPNMGHTGKRIAHRFVVLPDFQGLGIGVRLTEAVAKLETRAGADWSIRTSHPALIRALDHRDGWRCIAAGAGGRHQGATFKGTPGRGGSITRAAVSFRWVGLCPTRHPARAPEKKSPAKSRPRGG